MSHDPVELVLSKLQNVRKNGAGWTAHCPAHEDARNSLGIGIGEDGRCLLTCYAGCDVLAIVAAINLEIRDLFPPRDAPPDLRPSTPPAWTDAEGTKHEVVTRYEYTDADGKTTVIVCRTADKMFPVWNPTDKRWRWGSAPRLLYRLSKVVKAREAGERIFLCEGEKDVHTLEAWGLTATTASGGAGKSKWRAEYTMVLKDAKSVVCIPDNDEPGRAFMEQAAKEINLAGGHAVILDLAKSWKSMPPKADVSDLIAEGASRDYFLALVEAAEKARSSDGYVLEPAAAEKTMTSEAAWPKALGEAAYHGPLGGLVKAWAPHNEADPAAMLATVLVGFGSVAGCGPYHSVGDDRHPARLFGCVVGDSGSSRKGMSYGPPRAALVKVDPEWAKLSLASGLSTGEGLIQRVRDKVWKLDKDGVTLVVEDGGVDDKRVFLKEAEFARVLIVMARKDNTLSAIIRDLYDTGNAAVMTRHLPLRTTGAHVSMIAHITAEELRRSLTDVDAANGFANRFLFVCAKRSRRLPFGGRADDAELKPHIDALQEAARRIGDGEFDGEILWSKDAMPLWDAAYDGLMAGGSGLSGAIIARGQPQVLRIALIYALADCCHEIRPAHLEAALEVWRFCAASARYLFGGSSGNRTADQIFAALRASGSLNRTAISDLFDRHKTKAEIDAALKVLESSGLAIGERAPDSSGRPAELWRVRAEEDRPEDGADGS